MSTAHIFEFIFDENAGEFNGKKIRVLNENPKKCSLYDILTLLGDKSCSKTFFRLKEKYPEDVSLCTYYKFPIGQGQKDTPIVDANALVQILMIIPGEKACIFRSKAAKILVRYLGGDLTLFPEIQKNYEIQEKEPDHFGFKDLVMENIDKATKPSFDFLTPMITPTLLAPNVVYIMWIGYCHKNNVHIYKYGQTLDIKDRSRGHKAEQKSEEYILQISLGIHRTNELEKTIENFVTKLKTRLNVDKINLNREIFVCRNNDDLKEIMNKIIKVCYSKYFIDYIKEINIIDGFIDPVYILKNDIKRIKRQSNQLIAHNLIKINEIEEQNKLNNILYEIDIDNLDIDDDIVENISDIVSDIEESDDEQDELLDNSLSPLLPTFPYDCIEVIDNLDEFIQKYCEFSEDKKVVQFILYEAFTKYVTPTGFLGLRTFYKKIKEIDNITRSKTSQDNTLLGIGLKHGVIPDIYLYIRDFLHLKCDFNKLYKVGLSELSNTFLKYVEEELKLSKNDMRKQAVHKVNFNSIMKSEYTCFKFQYISQHVEGFIGLKLKSQTTILLSDLVIEFKDKFILHVDGETMNRRPVFHKFLKWYEETHASNDNYRSWGKTAFKDELNKYIEFKYYKWQNIKLIS